LGGGAQSTSQSTASLLICQAAPSTRRKLNTGSGFFSQNQGVAFLQQCLHMSPLLAGPTGRVLQGAPSEAALLAEEALHNGIDPASESKRWTGLITQQAAC